MRPQSATTAPSISNLLWLQLAAQSLPSAGAASLINPRRPGLGRRARGPGSGNPKAAPAAERGVTGATWGGGRGGTGAARVGARGRPRPRALLTSLQPGRRDAPGSALPAAQPALRLKTPEAESGSHGLSERRARPGVQTRRAWKA